MCARECVRGMHVGAGEAPGCRTPSPYSLYSPYRFYLELRLEVDAVEPALLVAQDAPHAATVDREVKAEPTGRGYGQRQS